MSINGASESSESFVEESWTSWFMSLSGNQYFCEVERSFIEDSFNLFGLRQFAPREYAKALDTILDRIGQLYLHTVRSPCSLFLVQCDSLRFILC